MKLFAVVMIAALVLGCSKDKKPDTTPAPPTDTTSTPTTDQPSPPTDTAGTAVPGEGQPCANKINLICPDGKIDACNKTPPSDKHMCVAK